MTARHEHIHRRTLPPVHVRECVRFGSCFEKDPRNLHGVGRRFLAIAFHAVRRNIMEQRGSVQRRVVRRYTRGSGANQLGILTQQ
jgi:hypothetical protein